MKKYKGRPINEFRVLNHLKNDWGHSTSAGIARDLKMNTKYVAELLVKMYQENKLERSRMGKAVVYGIKKSF